MMALQKIAEETTLSDRESVEKALAKLKSVPEHELYFYLVYEGSVARSSGKMRNGVVLAKVELDRRRDKKERLLAYSTTILSGIVGLAGVILGVLLAS